MNRRTTIPRVRLAVLTIVLACAATGWSETLSLPEALTLAKKQNGTVRSAVIGLESARTGVKIANAASLPTISPSYTRGLTQTTGNDSVGSSTFQPSQSALLTMNWTLWDNGTRRLRLNLAKIQADQQEATARHTLRSVLLEVHNSYFAALRAQELLKIQDAQYKRAEQILDQTKERVRLRDAAQKEILQATADLLNAKASLLQGQNQVQATRNNLSAIIGWDDRGLPTLEPVSEVMKPEPERLETAQIVQQSVAARADLVASRAAVSAADVAVELARLGAGPIWTAGAQYQKAFGDNFVDTTALTFSVSGPLYDGGSSRGSLKQAVLNKLSLDAAAVQSARAAKAEVESTIYEVTQNGMRNEAAQAALVAAKANYESAAEAQKLGAGTLLDVLTAQVSLVTAETNSVQAFYDLLASQVKLLLVRGRPLPGEEGA